VASQLFGTLISTDAVIGESLERVTDPTLKPATFNDFLFVALLRAAILAAVRKAGEAGLSEQDFGRSAQAALGFTAVHRERRQEWMLDPEARGVPQVNAEQALSRVLACRVWGDQRSGWRFTNPNLEELDLSGPVEEPRRDPQSTILIASNPSVTNLVNLALQFNRPTHQRMPNAACALAEPG
jgi:hypothetical protein